MMYISAQSKSSLRTRCFLAGLFCVLILSNSLSQNNTYLFKRYWYYKTRLNNDFLKVGLQKGESLPMPERNFQSLFNPNTSVIDFTHSALYGDELSTLGIYIGVLATEYHLLKGHGQSLDKIKYELFSALNAINRLDYYAESAFTDVNGNPGPNVLNGFMLKDDIDKDFLVNNYAHFNYFNKSSNITGQALDAGTNSPFANGINWISGSGYLGYSSYIPKNLTTDKGFTGAAPVYVVYSSNYQTIVNAQSSSTDDQNGGVINQDQFITLLIGLNLVNIYVIPGANNEDIYIDENGQAWNFPYESGSSITNSIHEEAKHITQRIVHYFDSYGWDLNNPITGSALGNHFGGEAAALSYPISEAACHALGFTSGTDGQPSPILGVPSSCSASSPISTSFPFWMGMLKNTQPNIDNGAFAVNLGATGDCAWERICFNCNARVNETYEDLAVNVRHWDFYHAPLLYEALNGYPASQDPLDYNSFHQEVFNNAYDILSYAPCEGPYNYGYHGKPNDNLTPLVYEWTSDSRIEHPNRREHYDDMPGLNNPFRGAYNGLDFMLYFNLMNIVHPTYYSAGHPYFDLSDLIKTTPVPSNQCPGSTSPCSFASGFETVTSSSSIAPGNNVQYRAGKNVHLKPGFSSSGSIFHAFIQPFTCGAGVVPGGDYQRAISDNDYGILNDPNVHPHLVSYGETSADIKKSGSNSLPTLSEKQTFVLYPNPSSGSVNIKVTGANIKSFSFEVFDVLGKIIMKEVNIEDKEKSINFSPELKGIFYIKVLCDVSYSDTKMFILQ